MQCLLSLVSELIDNTEMKCLEYRGTFMQHSFLWTESIDVAFKNFLQSISIGDDHYEAGVLYHLDVELNEGQEEHLWQGTTQASGRRNSVQNVDEQNVDEQPSDEQNIE